MNNRALDNNGSYNRLRNLPFAKNCCGQLFLYLVDEGIAFRVVCVLRKQFSVPSILPLHLHSRSVPHQLHQNMHIKGPGKRGHIVADTLLPMMFLGPRKLGNICCGHRMFLNKIRNNFCVPDTKFVSATMLRAQANGETFVSATMCPQQCVLVCQGLNV